MSEGKLLSAEELGQLQSLVKKVPGADWTSAEMQQLLDHITALTAERDTAIKNLGVALHEGHAASYHAHRAEAAEAELARIRNVLETCRATFMRYGELHEAKKTPEASEKALANYKLAVMCQAALNLAPQSNP